MRLALRSGLALVAVLAAACSPEIGDACDVHSDCSSTASDRLCDPTRPGGYCTLFNCEPGTCPEEAVCVAYRAETIAGPACTDDPRFVRTFCMRTCGGEGDCRSGYDCVDLRGGDNAWGAQVVEHGSHSERICSVPPETAPEGTPTASEYCDPGDASFPPPSTPPPLEAGASDTGGGG